MRSDRLVGSCQRSAFGETNAVEEIGRRSVNMWLGFDDRGWGDAAVGKEIYRAST